MDIEQLALARRVMYKCCGAGPLINFPMDRRWERMTDLESYRQRPDDASAGRALEVAFTQLPTWDVHWHKTIQAMTCIVCGYEKLPVGV